jgi:hypothetical protein
VSTTPFTPALASPSDAPVTFWPLSLVMTDLFVLPLSNDKIGLNVRFMLLLLLLFGAVIVVSNDLVFFCKIDIDNRENEHPYLHWQL